MRISDWSSDVCSSDLPGGGDDRGAVLVVMEHRNVHPLPQRLLDDEAFGALDVLKVDPAEARLHQFDRVDEAIDILGLEFEVDRVDIGEALEQHRLAFHHRLGGERSEEHTSELQSLMRNSYAVFCLKKKKKIH